MVPLREARVRCEAFDDSDVLLWWMAVDGPPAETVDRWCATLDEGERTRADRFHFRADRETYIAAHALTRALLAEVDTLPAEAWRFITTPTGRPEIAPDLDRSRLRFSLSHTRGLVACAVGVDHDLGVDVEAAQDRIANELDLAARFFAPSEVVLLRGTAEDQRRDAFLRIWTLKEAYIKATGQGLACPLNSFAFSLDPIKLQVDGVDADASRSWQFVQFDATTRHVIALAVRHAPAPLRVARRAMTVAELCG
jgi:4'-phosphopantetheinyl transferase